MLIVLICAVFTPLILEALLITNLSLVSKTISVLPVEPIAFKQFTTVFVAKVSNLSSSNTITLPFKALSDKADFNANLFTFLFKL